MKDVKRSRRVIKKNNRIKNVLLLLVIMFGIGFISTTIFAKDIKATSNYIVESNDTLWSIAKKICKKSDNKDLNIQKIVYEIKDMNCLTASNIFVGQELQIPIY